MLSVWFYLYWFYYPMAEGSLEVKLLTIWTDEKQSRDEAERREEKKKEDQKRESLRRKKIQVRETVGKSRNTLFFPMICGSGGSKSRLAKATGAEPAGQMRDEKVHAAVAWSTFPSQNVLCTPGSDHFWKLRCRKSERRCGVKHISKSKCRKHHMFAPLLEVRMLKKCTPLWREAHFEVKMYKTLGFGPLLEVQMSLRRFASLPYTTLRYITPHSTILHYITLHYTPQHYNYNYTTWLHSTTLHYIKFHYTTVHYTTLHYTTLH